MPKPKKLRRVPPPSNYTSLQINDVSEDMWKYMVKRVTRKQLSPVPNEFSVQLSREMGGEYVFSVEGKYITISSVPEKHDFILRKMGYSTALILGIWNPSSSPTLCSFRDVSVLSRDIAPSESSFLLKSPYSLSMINHCFKKSRIMPISFRNIRPFSHVPGCKSALK